MKKFANLLKVTEEDTIGTAIIKETATAYVKTTVTGLIGLGIITASIITLTNMVETKEEEELDKDQDDEDEKSLDITKEDLDDVMDILNYNHRGD